MNIEELAPLCPKTLFAHPILNSPYALPGRHGELDADRLPTNTTKQTRRPAEFISPIPRPRKSNPTKQSKMIFDEGLNLSTEKQENDPSPLINELRCHVDQWRKLPNPRDWCVTPETQRLLDHWRNHPFSGIRHTYFLGTGDPYKSLKTTLKAEINEEAWAILNSDTSRPFPKPKSGRIAVKVINHLGDEVMKVFKISEPRS